MGSSQIQQSQVPPITSTTIQSIQVSIENLIKSWDRRQRWQLFFNPRHAHKAAPWRTHLASLLESVPARVITIFLLLTDLVFTVLELSSSLFSCNSHKRHEAEEVWYHWAGVAMLSILCLRSMGLGLALGASFFRRPGYVVDGVVVVGALVLEAFVGSRGGGLLVVVSLWRVVRVVESAFELSDEAIEAQIEGIVCQFDALREENRRLTETIGEKDKIIERLQEELDQLRHA